MKWLHRNLFLLVLLAVVLGDLYTLWERRKCFSERCYLVTESELRDVIVKALKISDER